jgi:hypothetical protein
MHANKTVIAKHFGTWDSTADFKLCSPGKSQLPQIQIFAGLGTL